MSNPIGKSNHGQHRYIPNQPIQIEGLIIKNIENAFDYKKDSMPKEAFKLKRHVIDSFSKILQKKLQAAGLIDKDINYALVKNCIDELQDNLIKLDAMHGYIAIITTILLDCNNSLIACYPNRSYFIPHQQMNSEISSNKNVKTHREVKTVSDVDEKDRHYNNDERLEILRNAYRCEDGGKITEFLKEYKQQKDHNILLERYIKGFSAMLSLYSYTSSIAKDDEFAERKGYEANKVAYYMREDVEGFLQIINDNIINYKHLNQPGESGLWFNKKVDGKVSEFPVKQLAEFILAAENRQHLRMDITKEFLININWIGLNKTFEKEASNNCNDIVKKLCEKLDNDK